MSDIAFITQRFNESIAVKQDTLSHCLKEMAHAITLLTNALSNGNKVLICGNGGSAADAQQFAAELIMRYETNRQSLPAVALTTDSSALTAIGNDLQFEDVFARQVSGLGNAGDILVAISTSGDSPNIVRATQAAQEKQMSVLALTGKEGGVIRDLLTESDVEINVASNKTGRIQETHILIIHCLCEAMDRHFS